MDKHLVFTLTLSLTLSLLSRACATETEAVDAFYAESEYGYGPHEGYMSDWTGGREWGMTGRLNQPHCVDIPSNMTLCSGIGYTSMRLPNLLEHDTMQEVLQQASQWVPLLGRQCHPDTNVFLCSLFSPVCLDRPIYPCRSLCESVKAGCEQHMVKYGYPWPEMLSCDKFPHDNGLCIGMRTDRSEGERTCTACSQPNTFEALVDNYCSSTSVYRTKLRSERTEGDEKVVRSGKKIRKMKGDAVTDAQKRSGLQMHLSDSADCECRLAHDQSPDYYAMGNYSDGVFYAHAFHLYDRKNAELKRALRAIRKQQRICESVGMDMLVASDQPLPPPRWTNERRREDREQGRDNAGAEREQGAEDRKQQPNAEEIARRKAERAERRRQERLAQKNAAKESGSNPAQGQSEPDQGQGEGENVNNDKSRKRQRANEGRRSREQQEAAGDRNNKAKSRERASRERPSRDRQSGARSNERRNARRNQAREDN